MEKVKIEQLRLEDTKKLNTYIHAQLRGAQRSEEFHTKKTALCFIASKIKGAKFDSMIDTIEEFMEDDTVYTYLKKTIKENNDLINTLSKDYSENQLLATLLFSDSFNNDLLDITPPGISRLTSEILAINQNDVLLDITSGVGSFFTELAGKISFSKGYGIEINTSRYITSVIKAHVTEQNIHFIQADSLTKNMEEFGANKAFSNAPFNLQIHKLANYIEKDKRLSEFFEGIKFPRSSDWLFVLKAYFALKPNGRCVCIMSNNGIWNLADQEIRKKMIDRGIIEGVIALPRNLFPSTSIPTTMIVLSQNNTQVRMVDAFDQVTPGRSQAYLETENIDYIRQAYYEDTSISKSVTISEINENDFALNPIRYILEEEFKGGVNLGDLAVSINRGATIKSKELDELVTDQDTKYRYLMLQNITDGLIDPSLPHITFIDDRLERYCIKPNSLIISKFSPFKITSANFSEDIQVLANGNLYFLEINDSIVNPIYIEAFLQSDLGLSQLLRYSKNAVMNNISISDLKMVKIPMINRDEQNKIAEEYQALKDQLRILRYQIEKIQIEKARIGEEAVQ